LIRWYGLAHILVLVLGTKTSSIDHHDQRTARALLPKICDDVAQETPYIGQKTPAWVIQQRGEPRSASTFQYYALCSIMRLCSHRRAAARGGGGDHGGDGASEGKSSAVGGAVGCSFHQIGRPPRVSVQKRHEYPRNWGRDPTLALRPGTDGSAEKTVYFFSYKSPDINQSYFPAQVAHFQQLQEFAKMGVGVIPLQYQALFGLSDDEARELYAHLRSYGILRQCCSATQGSARRSNGLNAAHLVAAPPNYDDPRCDEYDLSHVESNFLSHSRLGRDYRGDICGSYGEDEPPIIEGFCKLEQAEVNWKIALRGDQASAAQAEGIFLALKADYCARAVAAFGALSDAHRVEASSQTSKVPWISSCKTVPAD